MESPNIYFLFRVWPNSFYLLHLLLLGIQGCLHRHSNQNYKTCGSSTGFDGISSCDNRSDKGPGCLLMDIQITQNVHLCSPHMEPGQCYQSSRNNNTMVFVAWDCTANGHSQSRTPGHALSKLCCFQWMDSKPTAASVDSSVNLGWPDNSKTICCCGLNGLPIAPDSYLRPNPNTLECGLS